MRLWSCEIRHRIAIAVRAPVPLAGEPDAGSCQEPGTFTTFNQ